MAEIALKDNKHECYIVLIEMYTFQLKTLSHIQSRFGQRLLACFFLRKLSPTQSVKYLKKLML